MSKSKPSPEELGSPEWQNQRKVSTYLKTLHLLELQLEAYAQLPNCILDVLKWQPHPIWNFPMSTDDPKVWQAVWERWARGQQAPYRKLIPGQTPETPVTDAMREPVKIDNDTGPAPPTETVERPKPNDSTIKLQCDEERETAIVNGQSKDLFDERSRKPNRIVRTY